MLAIIFFNFHTFTSHLEILFWVDEPGISLDADRPDVLEVDGCVCHRLVDRQIHTLEVFPRRKDDPADKPDGLNSTLVPTCLSIKKVLIWVSQHFAHAHRPLISMTSPFNPYDFFKFYSMLWISEWSLATLIAWCLKIFCTKLGSGVILMARSTVLRLEAQ